MRARTTNATHVPLLDTNPPRPGEASGRGGAFVKMRVQSIEPGGNPNLVLARRFNGATTGATDLPVEVERMMDVGEVFYAFRPDGGTVETHAGQPVVWHALNPQSVGQYQHQLYGNTSNVTMGHLLPLAVPDLNEVET